MLAGVDVRRLPSALDGAVRCPPGEGVEESANIPEEHHVSTLDWCVAEWRLWSGLGRGEGADVPMRVSSVAVATTVQAAVAMSRWTYPESAGSGIAL